MDPLKDTEYNDVNGTSARQSAASGRRGSQASQVVNKRNPPDTMIRICSWNVRTMSRQEKLENIKFEMRRLSIQILGHTEVLMKDKGDFAIDDVRVIYSGGTRRERGVALLLDRQAAKCVERVELLTTDS